MAHQSFEVAVQPDFPFENGPQRIGPQAQHRLLEELFAERVRRPADVVRLELLQLVLVTDATLPCFSLTRTLKPDVALVSAPPLEVSP